MDIFRVARERYSSRQYHQQPVEREKIERCLEAARLAPSARNAQPWHFVVVDDPVLKKAVAEQTVGPFASFNRFVGQAPVLIVVVSDKRALAYRALSRLRGRSVYLIDVGIAAEHICLQAVAEGLGTCLLGWFREKAIKRLLHIPRGKGVDLVITLGYPADKPKERKRKRLEEITSFNRYEETKVAE